MKLIPKHKFGQRIRKAQGGIKTTEDVVKRMIPIYGTYLEAEDLYNNPSWELAGWTALSALGDASMLVPLIGPEIKAATTAARTANKLGKAMKLSKAERAVPLVLESAKAASKAAKVADDVTWPAIYTVMARPSGVALSLPFREPVKSDTKPSNNSNWFVLLNGPYISRTMDELDDE